MGKYQNSNSGNSDNLENEITNLRKVIVNLTKVLANEMNKSGINGNNSVNYKSIYNPNFVQHDDVQDLINSLRNFEFQLNDRQQTRSINDPEVPNKLFKLIKDGISAGEKIQNRQNRREKRKYGEILSEKARREAYNAEYLKEQNASEVNAIFGKINGVANGAMQVVSSVHDAILAIQKSFLKEQKNAFDRSERDFQAKMALSNVVASNIITTFSSFATQQATEAAKAISKTAMDEANESIKYTTAIEMSQRELNVAEKERTLELIKAETKAAAGALNGIGSVVSMFGIMGPVIGGAITAIAGVAQGVAGEVYKETEMNIEQAKQSNEVYNTMMGRLTQLADKIKGIVSGIDDVANTLSDQMRESETKFRQSGLALGKSGTDYLKYMQQTAVTAAKTFGLGSEDMKAMMSGYENSSGRAITMTGNNFNQMEAISRTFGINNTEAASMIGDMNIFNVSVSDSYDTMDRMYKIATKLGLSTSKFSKELSNNLKMAQKYNFKGGVENMAKLTLWAEKTRFNLQNATAFADKMMSNNISDVLETSAKLQVLGGSASMFADPMAMMWEAGNDVGALAKRQSAMFADITGTFNKTTGETEFSEYDLRMIKARAEAMGMNYEDVLNQKRQSNKQGVINKALSKYNLDEDTLNGIGQRALYSKKRGTFVVNTLDGEKSIDELAQMNDEYRNKILMPDNERDGLMKIASDTRSLVEIETAQLKFLQASVGMDMWDTIVKSSATNRETQEYMYKNTGMVSEMKNSLISQADMSKKQTETLVKFANENKEQIQQYREFVLNNIGENNVLQAQEVAYLKLMAKKEGIAAYSTVAGVVGEVISQKSEDKRVEKLNEFKTKYSDNADVMDAINTIFPNGKISDGTGQVKSVKDGDVVHGKIQIPASSVTPINDGAGTMVETDPNDDTLFFTSAKKGGGIDKIKSDIIHKYENTSYTSPNIPNDMKVVIDGNLNLLCNNENIDIINALKNDSILLRQFTSMIIKSMDSKYGKPTKKY